MKKTICLCSFFVLCCFWMAAFAQESEEYKASIEKKKLERDMAKIDAEIAEYKNQLSEFLAESEKRNSDSTLKLEKAEDEYELASLKLKKKKEELDFIKGLIDKPSNSKKFEFNQIKLDRTRSENYVIGCKLFEDNIKNTLKEIFKNEKLPVVYSKEFIDVDDDVNIEEFLANAKKLLESIPTFEERTSLSGTVLAIGELISLYTSVSALRQEDTKINQYKLDISPEKIFSLLDSERRKFDLKKGFPKHNDEAVLTRLTQVAKINSLYEKTIEAIKKHKENIEAITKLKKMVELENDANGTVLIALSSLASSISDLDKLGKESPEKWIFNLEEVDLPKLILDVEKYAKEKVGSIKLLIEKLKKGQLASARLAMNSHLEKVEKIKKDKLSEYENRNKKLANFLSGFSRKTFLCLYMMDLADIDLNSCLLSIKSDFQDGQSKEVNKVSSSSVKQSFKSTISFILSKATYDKATKKLMVDLYPVRDFSDFRNLEDSDRTYSRKKEKP